MLDSIAVDFVNYESLLVIVDQFSQTVTIFPMGANALKFIIFQKL